MNIDRFLEYEKNRGESYKFLATCYSSPQSGLVTKLKKMEEVMGSLVPPAAEFIKPMKSNLQLKSLKIDYSALFVGPFKLLAPPYGSVYLEDGRRVMGDSTMDVLEKYKAAGLQVSSDRREVPDHITVELEFMYYLISNELSALEDEDLTAAYSYLEKQRAFLEVHLGLWVPKFADKVRASANTDFYQSLASLTDQYIKSDIKNIEDVSLATLDAFEHVRG